MNNEPVPIGIDAAPQIAAFTRVACPYDLLSTGSVERSMFGDTDPSIALASFDTGLEGIGSAVVRGTRGFVRFLAAHPRVRQRGVATTLLDRLEAFCLEHGATTMEVGTSAPRYVVPGVDVRETEALCFFRARGYQRSGDAVNQGVRLAHIPDHILPVHDAGKDDLQRIMPWLQSTFPQWIDEVSRSVASGTCVVHRDLGFACYDVNRDGWFGPMATKPGEGTNGVGSATLLGALRRMRTKGYEHAEIAWSGPLRFYLKTVGAHVSRVFWWYSKSL